AWRFWQHSDRGQVDGINGPVDFNVFHGTVEELQAFVDGIKETP
ncbi:glycoside hydrolase family 25 protein, partial [Escherichia coli]|nr:glycoside hydrolase family 25 protein [Escherichia coli]MDH6946890.1 glycoside hydrolase family 25 protein [Escherichia coli]MDH7019110.1 glycoside hydrolase family 25 protein [Escherichia coli]MDH7078579.1 glycoside hydrolase family 25 protein [Escherichia coli]